MGLQDHWGVRKSLCQIALGLAAIALATSLGTAAYADANSAASVLQSTTRAISQQTSAHVVFIAHSSTSSTTEKIIADVGSTSGTETLFEGKAEVAIRLTPVDAYVRGNSAGLTTLFGLTASEAKRLRGKWESWASGTKEYSSLKTDLTMSSVSLLLPKARGTRVSTEDFEGAKIYVLKWTAAATKSVPALSNALSISTTGAGLPIQETETATGVKVTTRISKWNETVSVLAPPASSTVASSRVTD
jgi:hypothetical protein